MAVQVEVYGLKDGSIIVLYSDEYGQAFRKFESRDEFNSELPDQQAIVDDLSNFDAFVGSQYYLSGESFPDDDALTDDDLFGKHPVVIDYFF